MTSILDRLGPSCPECREFAPFWKTQWALGKSFACKRCGVQLVIPKSTSMAGVGMFVLYYFGKDSFPAGPFAWAGLILAIGLPVTWLMTKPKKVPERDKL